MYATAVVQKKYRIEGRAKRGGKVTRFSVMAFDLDEARTIARERFGIVADTISLHTTPAEHERQRRDAITAYRSLMSQQA